MATNDDDLDLIPDPPASPATINLQDILSFCFPANIEHPESTLRLYILADHGPVWHQHSYLKCLCRICHHTLRSLLDQTHTSMNSQVYKHLHQIVHDQVLLNSTEAAILRHLCDKCREHVQHDVHLKCGMSGNSIVTHHEISIMCRVEEMNDLVSIYIPVHDLSYADRKQFLDRIPKRLRSYRNLTRSDLINLLQPIFTESTAHIDFYIFSRYVREHHQKVLTSMSNVDYLTKELVKEHRQKLSRRCPVRTDPQASTDIFQLLHRYSWQITDTHNRHAANKNVRVVMDRPPDSFYQWDGNFVKKLNDAL